MYILHHQSDECMNQINHSQAISTEEYAWEIKGGGIFSRELLFSLRTPVSVKAGEQVKFYTLILSLHQACN